MRLRGANPPSNLPDMIDKQTKEIRQDEDQTVYKSLDELADDLPDHSPRFILLSYPLTLVRLTTPTPTCFRSIDVHEEGS